MYYIKADCLYANEANRKKLYNYSFIQINPFRTNINKLNNILKSYIFKNVTLQIGSKPDL